MENELFCYMLFKEHEDTKLSAPIRQYFPHYSSEKWYYKNFEIPSHISDDVKVTYSAVY